jgi:hypothetical protein
MANKEAEKSTRSVELKFSPPDEFKSRWPGVDSITSITVPVEGELEDICVGHVQSFVNGDDIWIADNSKDKIPSVTLVTLDEFPRDLVHLVWVRQRGEWVAIGQERPQSNDTRSEGFSFHEPRALDSLCSQMLLKAYSVARGAVSLEDVGRTSPEKLESLPKDYGGRNEIDHLEDRVRLSYHLGKPYGIPDVDGIIDVPYSSLDKLPFPPEHVGSGTNSRIEIPVPGGQTVVFIFDSYMEKSLGPNEEDIYGPFKGRKLDSQS